MALRLWLLRGLRKPCFFYLQKMNHRIVITVFELGGFLTWTEDGLLRHTVYQGVREDKPAREVVRQRLL